MAEGIINDLSPSRSSTAPLMSNMDDGARVSNYGIFDFFSLSCMGIPLLDRLREYINKKRNERDHRMISYYMEQYTLQSKTLQESIDFYSGNMAIAKNNAIKCKRKNDKKGAMKYMRELILTRSQMANLEKLKDTIDSLWSKIGLVQNMKNSAHQLENATRVLIKMNKSMGADRIETLVDKIANENDLITEINDAFSSFSIKEDFQVDEDELNDELEQLMTSELTEEQMREELPTGDVIESTVPDGKLEVDARRRTETEPILLANNNAKKPNANTSTNSRSKNNDTLSDIFV
jgi:hypothetical protein